jgi:hypothetical protein
MFQFYFFQLERFRTDCPEFRKSEIGCHGLAGVTDIDIGYREIEENAKNYVDDI